MNRFGCLFLLVAMLLPLMLTGCGEEEEDHSPHVELVKDGKQWWVAIAEPYHDGLLVGVSLFFGYPCGDGDLVDLVLEQRENTVVLITEGQMVSDVFADRVQGKQIKRVELLDIISFRMRDVSPHKTLGGEEISRNLPKHFYWISKETSSISFAH